MKKNVLFIGSFKSRSSTGHTGGMTFACTSLINSSLSDNVNWILIDSTARHNTERSIIERSSGAFIRLIKFFWFLLSKKIDTVFAFAAHGYSFYEKGLMIRMASFFGKRTILAPRSGFIVDDIEGSSRFKRFAQRVFESSDIILCQGTYWKDYFLLHFDMNEEKLQVINNWIDHNAYRSKNSQTKRPLNIGFMGWIEKNKGVFDLAHVIYRLKNLEINWKFAGGGKELEELQRFFKEKELENNVEFLSWIYDEEKKSFLEALDIFILPSYREGMPNAVLEAMASGTAVIVSDVGAVSDLVKHGENGFLIEPGDRGSMQSIIEELYQDPETISKISKEAKAGIIAHFSVESVIRKFESIFQIN